MRRVTRVVIAALLVVTGVLVNSQVASAHDYKRQRSGSSLWAPQFGNIEARYFNPQNSDIIWRFGWGDYRHLIELTGAHRAFEMKAEVLSIYADNYNGYVAHNYPAYSRPYKDTMFMDGGSGTRTFGFGAGDANWFYAGPTWFAQVGGSKVHPEYADPAGYPMKVSIRAATREDHTVTCSAGDTWCVFPDYDNILVRGRDFYASPWQTRSRNWNQNLLRNQSFEEGKTGYAVQPGNNSVVYCPGTGYRSQCFLEFNRGSLSWASVYQDVWYRTAPGDNYTAESMIRCPANQPSCHIRLAYWGLPTAGQEVRYSELTIAADNRWYMCRVDVNHNGPAFQNSHDRLRFEVYDLNGTTLDVDYTTLALPVQNAWNTSGDFAAKPSNGALCEYADWYDG